MGIWDRIIKTMNKISNNCQKKKNLPQQNCFSYLSDNVLYLFDKIRNFISRRWNSFVFQRRPILNLYDKGWDIAELVITILVIIILLAHISNSRKYKKSLAQM